MGWRVGRRDRQVKTAAACRRGISPHPCGAMTPLGIVGLPRAGIWRSANKPPRVASLDAPRWRCSTRRWRCRCDLGRRRRYPVCAAANSRWGEVSDLPADRLPQWLGCWDGSLPDLRRRRRELGHRRDQSQVASGVFEVEHPWRLWRFPHAQWQVRDPPDESQWPVNRSARRLSGRQHDESRHWSGEGPME